MRSAAVYDCVRGDLIEISPGGWMMEIYREEKKENKLHSLLYELN